VWAWRNLVAPQFGGPWIAPDIRFRPLGLLDNDPYWEPAVRTGQAVLIVNVPDANARVWIQGQLTPETGMRRVFVTPPLDFGINYTYAVRAHWGDGDRAVDQTRTVPIRAGQQMVVNFSPTALRMPIAR
jgi:uncharacterized protein (TIGR03000 family)